MDERTLADENKEAIQKVFRLINYMCNDRDLARQFSETLRVEHRTLQQAMMGVFKHVIEDYAKQEGEDLRNQYSKKWARKVAALDEPGFPFF